jgi:hypothetical protein
MIYNKERFKKRRKKERGEVTLSYKPRGGGRVGGEEKKVHIKGKMEST